MNQDDRLGPYRLLRRLGEGGMGVVHLAVDPQGRQVAVKVLRAEVAGDDVARRRLSREVETMRRVRSEHIAEVLDADVTGHRPYIVTRYVPGQPLDELIKQDGPMGLPALLKVAHGVAAALAAVHSVGVIHRDLKPGNVLILDGQPVLIDFGIAQAVDATRLTQTGMFIGTPGYLAPEIIEGHEAGPEVDVHAWAGTLVFAATGQPPFGKGTLEMIFYNITAGKADVDAVPAPLRPVLRAALQRDPAKRPRATELAAQVERLLSRAGRPRVPDEVTTVSDFDDSGRSGHGGPGGQGFSGVPAGPGGQGFPAGPGVHGGVGAPSRPGVQGFPTGPGVPGRSGDPGDVPTPIASRPGLSQQSTPWPPAPAAQPREYVSLLGEQPPDPSPTRRVTAEELRQAAAAQQASYDLPTGMLSPEDIPTRNRFPAGDPPRADQARPEAGRLEATAPVADGDIPTQRVRPQDLAEYVRGHTPQPGRPAQPGQVPQPYPPQQAAFEQTPHVRQPAPPPYSYPPRPQAQAPVAPHPGQRPGHMLQRSKAYGVASGMIMIAVAVAAVFAPIVVAAVAIPAVILLRAADIAQPRLNTRRAAREAAADVIRVFGQPAALLKSLGITVALVPYALILGLPVTLLLTVVAVRMPPANALSWGTAVALWTVCAGPGVEGPGRQMRRTLASMLPSRSAAMIVASVLGALAALMILIAIGTVGNGARQARWAPVDVGTVVTELTDLRKAAR
ncbi:serine/threonine-protein kinase [Streptosporangium roseum]|uniref:serine/threonine-protein kinase n=1 Tax=Streptosporangium roseum TaxID=2001 RepID=UPI00331D5ED2